MFVLGKHGFVKVKVSLNQADFFTFSYCRVRTETAVPLSFRQNPSLFHPRFLRHGTNSSKYRHKNDTILRKFMQERPWV